MSTTYVNEGDRITPANFNSWLNRAAGEVYNVKAYGAIGDGVTDDTSSIQSAARAAAGGVLLFPAGSYKISSSITLGDRTAVVGVGSASRVSASTSNLGAQVGVFNVSNVSHIRFADLVIESGSTANGISFHGCNDVAVERCTIYQEREGTQFHNVACIGIYDDGSGSAGSAKNFRIVNNTFYPAHLGTLVQGASNYTLQSIVHTNNIYDCSNNSVGDGVIKFDWNVKDFVISDNVIDGKNIAEEAINVQEGAYSGSVRGNVASNMKERGIVLQEGQTALSVQDVIISENVINNCVLSGIEIAPNGNSVFSNIKIRGNSITSVGANGIRASTKTVDDLEIADNSILEHKSYGMLVGTPDAVIARNTVRTSTNDADSESLRLTATGIKVRENKLFSTNNSNNTISNSVAIGTLEFINNVGLKSEATGNASIPAGSTSTVVSHGLHVTPNQAHVQVQSFNSSAASSPFWIDSVGATTFSINVKTAPTQEAAYSWMILRRGG